MFGKFEHEYESWQIEFRIAQGHTYLKYINKLAWCLKIAEKVSFHELRLTEVN